MATLTCHTAGESHGPAVLAIVEGMPAGVAIDPEAINRELARRQGGYGRSGRQSIERDRVRILSGLLRGITIGSPVTLLIENRDHRIDESPPVTRPRPGHADFAGAMKYAATDCRAVIERASARETAARVAAGALAKSILEVFSIRAVGFVTRIGTVETAIDSNLDAAELVRRRDASDVYCPDAVASAQMLDEIRRAKEAKDTLGGLVEVRVLGCPPGLGSCMRWQDKLDGRLMRAVGSIQAIKGVEIGLGFAASARSGSSVHDPLTYDASTAAAPQLGFVRGSNNAGGIEGGMTNGMPIVVRAAMKPISTLPTGLPSVDLRTRAPARSDYERSDVCAVPAASVVAENVVAFEIAAAFLEKFGGDTQMETRGAYERWRESLTSSRAATGPQNAD